MVEDPNLIRNMHRLIRRIRKILKFTAESGSTDAILHGLSFISRVYFLAPNSPFHLRASLGLVAGKLTAASQN